MKRFLIPLIFFMAGCLAQNKEGSLRLNYLLNPVKTVVVFDFGPGLVKDTDFDLNYRRIMHPPFNTDTTLEMGIQRYKLVLFLERPVLARLHIGDQWDHLYLVPGKTTHTTYDPLKENQDRIDVTGLSIIKDINEYYDARFDLLGVNREILQAYQMFSRMMEPLEAKTKYDSIYQIQSELLEQLSDKLPRWFVQLEQKNLKYSSELFKLSSILFRNSQDQSLIASDYSTFELIRNLNDTIGLLTSWYSWSLGQLAYLTYCKEDCFNEDLEISIPARNRATLSMAGDITNHKVRQVFLAQNLMRIYHSSQSLPDSLVYAFEKQIEKPYMDMVSKYKNPSLTGQVATSFYLADETGQFYTLKDLEGHVVLLNYWFVGCKPCELELPYEKTLVKELEDEKFKLVNICTNTPEEVWKHFVEENEMPGINLYAKGNWGKKLTDAYQVTGFPTYVLIDKNGIIAMDKVPRPSSESLISEIRSRLEK